MPLQPVNTVVSLITYPPQHSKLPLRLLASSRMRELHLKFRHDEHCAPAHALLGLEDVPVDVITNVKHGRRVADAKELVQVGDTPALEDFLYSCRCHFRQGCTYWLRFAHSAVYSEASELLSSKRLDNLTLKTTTNMEQCQSTMPNVEAVASTASDELDLTVCFCTVVELKVLCCWGPCVPVAMLSTNSDLAMR
jgi:hypothetical protein